MNTLIPLHPSITEMSDDDRDRLYLDDEPRWVGPTAPSTRYVEVTRYLLDYAAGRLADMILDAPDDDLLEWRREDYAAARDRARQLEKIQSHLYSPGARGMAGWIVWPGQVSGDAD